MLPLLLISLFSFFFIVSFVYIIRRDYLFGLYYFFLFVYTIFTQIGYAIYPEKTIEVVGEVYYGEELFFDYWLFVSLSFFAIFLAFMLFWRNEYPRANNNTEDTKRRSQSVCRRIVFFVTVIVFNTIMSYSFLSNYESIGYIGDIFFSKFFGYGFFLYVGIIMVLYAKLKTLHNNVFERVLSQVLLLVSLTVLLAISIRSGQRSQIIALAIGLASYEFISLRMRFGTLFKKLVKLSPLIIGMLILAIILTDLRLRLGGYISPREFVQSLPMVLNESVSAFFQSIIYQDYFMPSLLLFASIHHQLVFPDEVIRSNVLNSVLFMGYPYLAETIGKFLNPSVTRTQGYAYYLLAEGFNFAGWFGILYNALVVWGGLSLWRKLFLKGDKDFNNFMAACMAMQAIAIVRGQSVYFIKDIYLFWMPLAILYHLATGRRLSFIFRFR